MPVWCDMSGTFQSANRKWKLRILNHPSNFAIAKVEGRRVPHAAAMDGDSCLKVRSF